MGTFLLAFFFAQHGERLTKSACLEKRVDEKSISRHQAEPFMFYQIFLSSHIPTEIY